MYSGFIRDLVGAEEGTGCVSWCVYECACACACFPKSHPQIHLFSLPFSGRSLTEGGHEWMGGFSSERADAAAV